MGGELPADKGPDVEYQEGQAIEKEAQGRITAGREGSQLSHLAITGFNPEASAIAFFESGGLAGHTKRDIEQPLDNSLGLRLGVSGADTIKCSGRAIGEGIVSKVAGIALTKGLGSACFAADRTGDDGRNGVGL